MCSKTIDSGLIDDKCSRLTTVSCPFSCDLDYAATVDNLQCNAGTWYPDQSSVCTSNIKQSSIFQLLRYFYQVSIQTAMEQNIRPI